MTHAASQIYSTHGISGLWRGVSGAVPRVAVGSAAQLATFSKAMELVHDGLDRIHSSSPVVVVLKQSWVVAAAASLVSGVAVVAFFTPFDVISTRLYNQGNPDQCFPLTIDDTLVS
jgi:solute carrier family 25 protein 34/35